MFIQALCMFMLTFSILMWYMRTSLSYWVGREVPSFKPSFPYGNMKNVYKTKHFIEILTPLYERFKREAPFAGLYHMLTPVAVALELDMVRNILIKDFQNFEDRGMYHNERDDPLSAHLFRLDGPQWRTLRMKFQPTFSKERMRNFFPMACGVGQQLASVMQELSENAPTNVLEITNLMYRFTADVLGSCVIGVNINALRDPEADLYLMAKRAFTQRRHGPLINGFMENFPEMARRLRFKQMEQDVSDFYLRLTQELFEQRFRLGLKRNDYMDVMLDMKRSYILNMYQMAAQLYTFFSSGFDTSASTLGFVLYELAKQPQLQARLRAEIEVALANTNGEMTYESMQEMLLMERTIAETLRLYPVLPYITRIARDFYFARGEAKWYIEPGQMVIIPIYAIHHDPDIYTNPERFDPERFKPEELAKRPAAAWLPFGDGSRNCIGMRFGKMQTFIGLTYLLRKFHFSVSENTPTKIRFDKESMLLRPISGIHLRVQKLRKRN